MSKPESGCLAARHRAVVCVIFTVVESSFFMFFSLAHFVQVFGFSEEFRCYRHFSSSKGSFLNHVLSIQDATVKPHLDEHR